MLQTQVRSKLWMIFWHIFFVKFKDEFQNKTKFSLQDPNFGNKEEFNSIRFQLLGQLLYYIKHYRHYRMFIELLDKIQMLFLEEFSTNPFKNCWYKLQRANLLGFFQQSLLKFLQPFIQLVFHEYASSFGQVFAVFVCFQNVARYFPAEFIKKPG